jgi:hypothetical protein
MYCSENAHISVLGVEKYKKLSGGEYPQTDPPTGTYDTTPASYPGANNVLKIATLQCFYIDQWLPPQAPPRARSS